MKVVVIQPFWINTAFISSKLTTATITDKVNNRFLAIVRMCFAILTCSHMCGFLNCGSDKHKVFIRIKIIKIHAKYIEKDLKMSICALTDSAKKKIDQLCAENNYYAISINLKGGGCAGFEYDWGTVVTLDEIEHGDEIITTGNNGNLVIGSHSIMFLIGTEIDYVSSIVGSNFEIRNPNAKNSCGCGISVNFDMDKIPQF